MAKGREGSEDGVGVSGETSNERTDWDGCVNRITQAPYIVRYRSHWLGPCVFSIVFPLARLLFLSGYVLPFSTD
jgi:hypothetical protein